MLTRFYMFVGVTVYVTAFILVGTHFANAAMSKQEQQSLLSYVDEWAAAENFNGVIAIRCGKGPLLTAVFGIASAETKRPLTRDTVFQTGSIDKWFASIAIFSLIEDELVSLHEPIGTYTDDLSEDIGDQVSLHHLMTNRSGLSDSSLRAAMGAYIGAKMSGQPPESALPTTLGTGIRQLIPDTLGFEPGSQFDYVNANWMVVRHIIEEVTGKTYESAIKERVFDPAGMTQSGFFVDDLLTFDGSETSAAIGFRDASEGFPGDYPLPAFLGGGTYTTVADIAALQQSLDDGESLSPMTIELFRTVTTEDEDYAYGGYLVTSGEQRYSWQSGSNGATNVVSIHAIDGDFTFVAASNTGHSQDTMFALGKALEAGEALAEASSP